MYLGFLLLFHHLLDHGRGRTSTFEVDHFATASTRLTKKKLLQDTRLCQYKIKSTEMN